MDSIEHSTNCENTKSISELRQEKRNRNLFPISVKDRIFALVQLIFCTGMIFFGVCNDLNFGLTFFYLLIFACDSIYLFNKNTKTDLYTYLCGILALSGGFVFTVTSNYSIRLLLIPVLFVLCVIWFSGISGIKIPGGDLGIISLIGKNGISDSICNAPDSVVSVISDKDGKNKNAGKALIGILCALPVAGIVVFLLIEADEAFEALSAKLFSSVIETIIKIIAGIILTVLIIAFSFTLKKKPALKETSGDYSKIDSVYIISFLSVLSICYMGYLFSQLAYFFSAFKKILPLEYGLNYAEYARRGFFELCAVSFINLAIIFAVLILVKKHNGKIPVAVKIICIFISIFTLILCATSVSKMILYIDTYGLTVLRVGTTCFTIIIAITFIAMIMRLFNSKIKVLHTALIFSSAVLVVLGLVNINKVVAQYNYNAYITGKLKEIDVSYMGELGSEGVEYLELLTHSDDKNIAESATDELYWAQCNYFTDVYVDDGDNNYHYEYTDEKINDGIFYYNISRNKAYKVFEKTDFSDYAKEYFSHNDSEW